MNTTVTRQGANHTFHLIMTVLTLGAWGMLVWPVAALIGRRTKVTHHGIAHNPYAPDPRAVSVPVGPQPNAVNPYNGQAYYDPHKAVPYWGAR